MYCVYIKLGSDDVWGFCVVVVWSVVL